MLEQSSNQDDSELDELEEQPICSKQMQAVLDREEKQNMKRITPPYLSKYEKAFIIGMRAQQISRSPPLYIYLDEEQLKSLNPLEIA